ncbi:hypothetical protein CCACVL1_07329, partial [Corchorus capsularis]
MALFRIKCGEHLVVLISERSEV